MLAADCTVQPDIMEKTIYLDHTAMSTVCQTPRAHDLAVNDKVTDSRSPATIRDDLQHRLTSFASTAQPFQAASTPFQIERTYPSVAPPLQPATPRFTPAQASVPLVRRPIAKVEEIDRALLFKMRMQSHLQSAQVVMPSHRRAVTRRATTSHEASTPDPVEIPRPNIITIDDSALDMLARKMSSETKPETASVIGLVSAMVDTTRVEQQRLLPGQTIEEGDLLCAWD